MTTSKQRHRRGTALVMIVLMSIIITGYIMVLSWAAGVQSAMATNLIHVDANYYAAEAGAERAAWYVKNGVAVTQPLTGTINGLSYSATWATVSGSTQRITCVTTNGSAKNTVLVTVTPPSSAPVLSLGDNFNNKNLKVTGNVTTGGSYTNDGTGTLTGNLTYQSSASSTGNVSGTITKATGSFSFMDMNALGTTLIAAAGTTYTGTQTNKTFDFTAVPGNPKVIYVNGPVVNPTFIGSGTLYSSGAVSGLSSFGTSSNPVNIVAKAAITNTSGNLTIYGSLYTGGAWSYGQINMTGLAYVSGTVSSTSSSVSTLTETSVPWFDPRSSGGSGGGTTTFASFAGASP